MNTNREKALNSLLHLDQNLSDIRSTLSEFKWDCDNDIVVMKNEHAASILKRYVDKVLDKDVVEEWANAIECREDVGFENDELKELIYELANPCLVQELSETRAQELLNLFSKN